MDEKVKENDTLPPCGDNHEWMPVMSWSSLEWAPPVMTWLCVNCKEERPRVSQPYQAQ